ncbi:MAG: AAA family ATPase [Methyloprofundus sp.]|nr:AAA family ATPase [Methyloprofundus sp.]
MKIHTLSYSDKKTGWKLEPISFGELTLLVGASGVGKTRILQCILDLQSISKGNTLDSIQWSICFSTKTGHKYQWEGEFSRAIHPSVHINIGEQYEAIIVREKLRINNEIIIDRSVDNIIFRGVKTVKLSPTESAIALLKEEYEIKEIHTEFDRIIFDNNAGSVKVVVDRFSREEEFDLKLAQYTSLQSIRESSEAMRTKLYFTYINQRKEFDNIAELFIDVFPYVEEIKVEALDPYENDVPAYLMDTPFIQIKEKGVDHWIDETCLSSGMHRTLLHIAELYLCADSSLILIDEFENSLGVNCIDELTNSIVSAGRDIQFILTSHHPYIINNISTKYWKLIARKAGSVIAYDAEQFNFDKSKHKAFTQLMNLDLYAEGANA